MKIFFIALLTINVFVLIRSERNSFNNFRETPSATVSSEYYEKPKYQENYNIESDINRESYFSVNEQNFLKKIPVDHKLYIEKSMSETFKPTTFFYKGFTMDIGINSFKSFVKSVFLRYDHFTL